jgi:hypothetical protein
MVTRENTQNRFFADEQHLKVFPVRLQYLIAHPISATAGTPRWHLVWQIIVLGLALTAPLALLTPGVVGGDLIRRRTLASGGECWDMLIP